MCYRGLPLCNYYKKIEVAHSFFILCLAAHYLSCEMYSMYNVMDGEVVVTIDPDGSGEIMPFNVKCDGKSKYKLCMSP